MIKTILMPLLSITLCGCSEPDFTALIGQTERQVIAAEGDPNETWPGHYGNPPESWLNQFGKLKTNRWDQRGYETYCLFEDQNGHWVLVDTATVPAGATID